MVAVAKAQLSLQMGEGNAPFDRPNPSSFMAPLATANGPTCATVQPRVLRHSCTTLLARGANERKTAANIIGLQHVSCRYSQRSLHREDLLMFAMAITAALVLTLN